jgi:hypothetical protein
VNIGSLFQVLVACLFVFSSDAAVAKSMKKANPAKVTAVKKKMAKGPVFGGLTMVAVDDKGEKLPDTTLANPLVLEALENLYDNLHSLGLEENRADHKRNTTTVPNMMKYFPGVAGARVEMHLVFTDKKGKFEVAISCNAPVVGDPLYKEIKIEKPVALVWNSDQDAEKQLDSEANEAVIEGANECLEKLHDHFSHEKKARVPRIRNIIDR